MTGAPGGVHNHPPETGPGIGCPEHLIGECRLTSISDARLTVGGPWVELMAEARAFEEWYAPTRMSVNAWVGVDTTSGFYGGWSVEGEQLYDEWDESVMTTAEGPTPELVIADLIRIARYYRERCDADRDEMARE